MVARSLPATRSRIGWIFSSVASLVLAATLLPAMGCGDGESMMAANLPPVPADNPKMPTDPPLIEDLTRDYYRDAKPLLERYCTSCHTAGGLAPFALTDYQSAKTYAAAIKSAVESKRMPPWPASDKGVALRYSRAMPENDKAALLDWIADGGLEGDKNATPRAKPTPAETVAKARPDIVADMGLTYTPNTKLTDDYRCFIVDPKLTEDRFMAAGDVLPGNPAIVHHVILFEIPANKAADARKKDDSEAGPGYTCFGGPGVGGNAIQFVIGWAPGGVTARFPDNDGLLLHKGSLLVMQVHYNLSGYKGVGDRSVVNLELTGSPPSNQILIVPIANPSGLKIPAGDKNATQEITVPVSLYARLLKLPTDDLTVIAVSPHMHMLGTSIVSELEGKQILVDIPRWDFHWQYSYRFKESLNVRGTDTLKLTCTYDNSYANQPVINGEKQMPRDVSWGEGTLDEMCLTFLSIRIPRTPPT